ncbi:hypothetical protein [Geodermatophilus amargosae]|nr:hypothetical protein [Geodermatophilus amargosae]
MDAFQQAVDQARRQLIREEGQNVSVRELIRRAGFDDSRRASVARHLNPNQAWPKGHRVPPETVRALAAVLPISESDLVQAAQVAAGYQVRDEEPRDLGFKVARFLGDEEVSAEEKARLRAQLLQLIAEDLQRSSPGVSPTSPAPPSTAVEPHRRSASLPARRRLAVSARMHAREAGGRG